MKTAASTSFRLASLLLCAAGLVGLVAPANSAAAAPGKARPGGPDVLVQPIGLRLTGPVTWTATSGRTGSETRVIGKRDRKHGAYSLTWREDNDNPCHFRVGNKSLDTGGGEGSTVTEDLCKSDTGDPKSVSRGGAQEYITAVSVCLTDKKDPHKDKLKGLRVWGKTLYPDTRTLGPENGPDEDRHGHCKEWREKVSCPEGQVAQRIKVHFTPKLNGPSYAHGISLGCRALEE